MCGILNISHPCRPPWPVMRIALPYFFSSDIVFSAALYSICVIIIALSSLRAWLLSMFTSSNIVYNYVIWESVDSNYELQRGSYVQF
jgi:hypothetical protein